MNQLTFADPFTTQQIAERLDVELRAIGRRARKDRARVAFLLLDMADGRKFERIKSPVTHAYYATLADYALETVDLGATLTREVVLAAKRLKRQPLLRAA